MESAMSERNVDLVRSLYAAWSRGDVEAFLQVLAPDVEWRFADNFIYGAVNPVIGRDALRKGSLRRLKTEWEGFDGVLEDMLDAGDHVIGLGHYVGRYRLTGEQIRAQFAHVWTVKDGQVTRWRQYVDTKQFADAVSETSSITERKAVASMPAPKG
jgi:ketosteroid isomerase-like protein